jgi:hypothetical protein
MAVLAAQNQRRDGTSVVDRTPLPALSGSAPGRRDGVEGGRCRHRRRHRSWSASIRKKRTSRAIQDRRRFLATLSAAGAAGLISPSRSFSQEPPPETTIIRLAKNRTTCIAPQYVVADLLHLEGFTEVYYVATDAGAGQSKALARGEIDFTLHFSATMLIPIDAGERITIIAGIYLMPPIGAFSKNSSLS